MFSDVAAQRQPHISKDKQNKEYDKLLQLFLSMLKNKGYEERWKALKSLMKQRAYFLIGHALDGLQLSHEDAIKLINDHEDLSDRNKKIRKSLLAAIDNLVDFAVAEEYQMTNGLIDIDYTEDIDEQDHDFSYNMKVFDKYNKRYALVENLDVIYAASIAYSLSKYNDNTLLIYTTQGDERVRPWHEAWDGFEETLSNFPEWLIPPIEPGCRCYLVEETLRSAVSKARGDVPSIKKPDWINPAYSESVAKGGKIFSDEHSYFQVAQKDIERLRDYSIEIKNTIEEWLKEQ